QGQAAEWKSSSDWLLTHSLYSSGLSLSTLLSHGTTKIRQVCVTGACFTYLGPYSQRVSEAIELYHGRIRWLNQGSMKVFGLVKGSRVGVIVDTSDVNCTKDRLPDLQKNLLLDSFSLSPSLPRPPNHNVPLSIKPPGVPPSSSADWLRNHGLKAKRLGLYQVLSPNAYSLLEGFVPILNKTVSSTVHEKAMVQFEWHDGTVKNVHVDLPLIYHYQKQLMSAVAVLERRVQWLSSGSRQIWGTVCEQRVVIVVDMSMMIPGFSLHIQHSLRVLLEEQLANKHSFNIIAFGSAVRAWRERLALTSPENLQEAWQWVQGLQCSGSRNTLAALRLPLEGDLNSGGLYLFTSGLPDQEIATVSSYVSECCSGRPLRLHICLLTGEETEGQTEAQTGGCPPPHHATREETAGALRELAQAGNGRFHWISETGTYQLIQPDIYPLPCWSEPHVSLCLWLLFQGMVKHLQLTPGELKQYLTQTERLLLRYMQRLQWLLSGSRRVFGAVLEREVCVLLDVSGSMAPCLGELKTKLASLIWEQLHHNTVRFSLLAFSEGVKAWRPALQEPTEEACRDAVQWAYQLNTHGGTNTLEALQTGCGFGDSVGLYLLSDGKPDSSCSLVLKETERLTTGNHITIHTVSFNCTDSSANDFLKKLAHQTGGRYHRCHDNVDALSGLLESGLSDGDEPTLPALEGDDLRRLAQEIDKLRHFRKQAQVFRFVLQ
uniref:VWFA domain-containing protein n=1 Tax=Oncorhynchus mykiss TaxID=8022 RepID=A0A8K9XS47_ONCMY